MGVEQVEIVHRAWEKSGFLDILGTGNILERKEKMAQGISIALGDLPYLLANELENVIFRINTDEIEFADDVDTDDRIIELSNYFNDFRNTNSLPLRKIPRGRLREMLREAAISKRKDLSGNPQRIEISYDLTAPDDCGGEYDVEDKTANTIKVFYKSKDLALTGLYERLTRMHEKNKPGGITNTFSFQLYSF